LLGFVIISTNTMPSRHNHIHSPFIINLKRSTYIVTDMAAPTQILPDWLSYSATIITGAGGLPLTTSTAVIYLPLTYYGPSVSVKVIAV